MAKRKAAKKTAKKSGRSQKLSKTSVLLIKGLEERLKKKRQELVEINERHRKIAGEFLDLWVKVKRLKKQDTSLVTLEKQWLKQDF